MGYFLNAILKELELMGEPYTRGRLSRSKVY